MASPTACLVSIEVNYLTVTGDFSSLVILLHIDERRLQNNTENTKTALFLKLSHKMGHIKIWCCILFGGDLGGHHGLATSFLKTIRWA